MIEDPRYMQALVQFTENDHMRHVQFCVDVTPQGLYYREGLFFETHYLSAHHIFSLGQFQFLVRG